MMLYGKRFYRRPESLGKEAAARESFGIFQCFAFFCGQRRGLKAFCRILRVKIKIGKPPYRTIYAENAMAGFTAPVTGANAGIRFRSSVDPIHFARLTGGFVLAGNFRFRRRTLPGNRRMRRRLFRQKNGFIDGFFSAKCRIRKGFFWKWPNWSGFFPEICPIPPRVFPPEAVPCAGDFLGNDFCQYHKKCLAPEGDEAMKFFIDTANLDEIKEAWSLGVIAGVTTNPSLVAKEGNVSFEERLREICELVDGPVSAEVISLDSEGMIKEAKELAAIAPNITIKIPMTAEGLKAINALAKEGIKTNCTLIFSANQALLAARAGATYVSPFLGRLDDIGHNGLDLISTTAEIFAVHDIETEIIAASIRHPQHVTEAALRGAHIATVPYKVLMQLCKHPLTDRGIEIFLEDWKKRG